MAWSATARARRLASLVGDTDLPPAHEGPPGWGALGCTNCSGRRVVASLSAPRVASRPGAPGPWPFRCPFESPPSTLSPDAVPVGDTAPQGHRAERQRGG